MNNTLLDAALFVSHKKHSFMKKPLKVRYVPAPPPPKQYEKDKLLIKNIPDGVSEDLLEVFVEGRLGLESETDFTIDFKSNCALLSFRCFYTDNGNKMTVIYLIV